MFKIILSNFFSKIGSVFYYISGKIYKSPQKIRTIKWFKDNGDKTLRLNYELNNNSIIFDVGGYEGQWASDIFSKYVCEIHIFEPILEFAENIKKRFSKNNKIFVNNFGLSNKTEEAKISLEKDASSTFKKGGNIINIKVKKAIDYIKEKNIKNIDLIKINIEGGEYELLEHLIDSGFIKNIKNIQVQFHDFVDNAEKRMEKIQKKLTETHTLTYQYKFVWENWKLKE